MEKPKRYRCCNCGKRRNEEWMVLMIDTPFVKLWICNMAHCIQDAKQQMWRYNQQGRFKVVV